ncbi:unnamed protein product [Sphagnum jensenii]|uniref:Type-F conjugative transfer system pilin assembly protein TrbC n=1 Tax=Sphagnum jensenii TaxID=128206 RepID=A0ABP0VK44_9BRYO
MTLYGEDVKKIMDDADDSLQEGIPQVEEYFRNPGEIKKTQESFFGFGKKRLPPEPVVDPAKSCQGCRSQSIESLGKTSSKPEQEKTAPRKISALSPASWKEVIVFVSLGMPETTLKQLAQEAEKTKVRLVVRGLLDNSFKNTMVRIQELKIPVEIDPTLFDLFQVERVPTFIRCVMTSEGAVKSGHDRLAGNIFIRDALEKFEKFGDLT